MYLVKPNPLLMPRPTLGALEIGVQPGVPGSGVQITSGQALGIFGGLALGAVVFGMAMQPKAARAVRRSRRKIQEVHEVANPMWQTFLLLVAAGVAEYYIIKAVGGRP